MVLYEYRPSRGGRNSKEFLDGFLWYLQTDGYSGYRALTEIKHLRCRAHARRKFNEAVQALPKGSKTGATAESEASCQMLSKTEQEPVVLRFPKRRCGKRNALFACCQRKTERVEY